MLPDRVSNPGPLTYESGALPIALRGPVGILPWSGKVCNNSIDGPLGIGGLKSHRQDGSNKGLRSICSWQIKIH